MFGISWAFGLTLTALLLAAGHWFPWPKRLHRLLAYAYGIGAILAGADHAGVCPAADAAADFEGDRAPHE